MTVKPRMIDYALQYAQKGWHVFPLHWPIKVHPAIDYEQCSCGKPDCISPAKHPRTSNGLLDATTNPETIRQWWSTWPDANIGIRTGVISGIVVLDVDAKNGGLESWAELQDIHGLVDPLTATTGGGGLHLYFVAPEDELKSSSGEIAPGIDTRAEGGYVVAPPSLHMSGRRYTWEGEDL